jgi:hypothetical protein
MKSLLPHTLIHLHTVTRHTEQLLAALCQDQGWGLRTTAMPFLQPAPEGHTVSVVDGSALMRAAPGTGRACCLLICDAHELPRWAGSEGPVGEYHLPPLHRNRLKEQVARLRAGASQTLRQSRSCGGLFLDPVDRRVLWQGQPVDLTWREYEVLRLLSEDARQVVPRARIEEALYRWGQDFESNTIDVLIHHLRRKLDPGLIVTVRGLGFRLAVDPSAG